MNRYNFHDLKQNRFYLIIVFCFCYGLSCFGQSADSSVQIKISGYIDAYYASYSDSAKAGNYQKFASVAPRSNAFGLNIAQVTGQYNTSNLRATATFQVGDIPTAAWSATFNNVQEANIGARIFPKFWIDAGFFKTHIGTEALLPKDNIASSVATITFFEPWYQSGIKLSYDVNAKCNVALFIENGYNQFVPANRKKSLGTVFNYTFNSKFSFGYYNFLGDNTPDSIKVTHLRFLNNFVFNYQLNDHFKIVLGIDYITQQHSQLADSAKSAVIYSGILTLNYKFNPRWGIYARGDTYHDADGFLSGTIIDANNGKLTGYIISGLTLGAEWKPAANAFLRLECRDLVADSGQYLFYTAGTGTNKRFEIVTNAGIWF